LLSGIPTYEELGTRILKHIESAHGFRQVQRVRELARILSNVPIREYQLIAQYYLVWCKCQELQFHSDILERIVEKTETYKAKALISRAAFDVYQGNIEQAFHFYAEALKTRPTLSDFIKASTGIATLKSMEGFHTSALRDLERLLPLLSYAEPLNYFEVINSCAVELIANNRLSEAHNAAVVAVSSPFGPFYPEWQETLSDVRSKRKRRSTVMLSRSPIEQAYEPEIEIPRRAKARVQAGIDFMNENYQRKIVLDEISEAVNISTDLFSRIFKIETGFSPIDYLMRLRMEKASWLLKTSFLSIKQVMAAVGYNSKGHFAKHFRRQYDLSPSEYRDRFFYRD